VTDDNDKDDDDDDDLVFDSSLPIVADSITYFVFAATDIYL
jgi:hypothetical protein